MALAGPRAGSASRPASLPAWQAALVSVLLAAAFIIGVKWGSSSGSGSSLTLFKGTPAVAQDNPDHAPPAGARVNKLLRHWRISPEHVWTQLLMEHGSPSSAMVVEVGSFNGDQCRQALDAGFGKVVCFEPSPTNYERVQGTLAAFASEPRLKLERKVVSNTTGDQVPFHAVGGTGDHAGEAIPGELDAFKDEKNLVMVESVALDDYFPDVNASNPIYLAKIDTQGFDGAVLYGMRRLLAQHAVRTLIVELWPQSMGRAVPCEDALTLLVQSGYEVYELGLNVLGPEQLPALAEQVARPADVRQLCAWYLEKSGKFGIWSDVIAVAPEALA